MLNWSTISGTAEDIFNAAKDFLTEKINLPSIDVSTVWNNVKEKASEIWTNVKDVFSSFEIEWPDFGQLASYAFAGLKQAASDAWDWIKGLFGGGEQKEELKTGEVDTSSVDDAMDTVEVTTGDMSDAFKNVKLKIAAVDTQSYTELARVTNTTINAMKTVFTNLKLSVPAVSTWSLTNARVAVNNAVSAMRSAMNFSWSLPTLHGHLPVISASMKTARSSDGKSSVDYPSISLAGYTYFAQGGILTQPTLFGAIGGESGPEAVLPLDKLWDGMDKRYGNGGMVNNFYINGGSAPEIADEIARTLRREMRMA